MCKTPHRHRWHPDRPTQGRASCRSRGSRSCATHTSVSPSSRSPSAWTQPPPSSHGSRAASTAPAPKRATPRPGARRPRRAGVRVRHRRRARPRAGGAVRALPRRASLRVRAARPSAEHLALNRAEAPARRGSGGAAFVDVASVGGVTASLLLTRQSESRSEATGPPHARTVHSHRPGRECAGCPPRRSPGQPRSVPSSQEPASGVSPSITTPDDFSAPKAGTYEGPLQVVVRRFCSNPVRSKSCAGSGSTSLARFFSTASRSFSAISS